MPRSLSTVRISKAQGKVVFILKMRAAQNYKRAIQSALKDDIFYKAAVHLQERAIAALKYTYLSTKGKRSERHRNRKYKDVTKRLETYLFDVPKPKRTAQGTYQIRTVPNLALLNRKFPYLKWQEGGANPMLDNQPYRITFSGKLFPITKRKAQALRGKKLKDSRGRITRFNQIRDIPVLHPGLEPRHFILTANRLVKTQGGKIVSDFIRKELAKRGLKFR